MSKRVPEYALKPLKDLFAYLEDCDRLLHLSIRGIAVLRGIPQVIDVLRKVEPEEDGEANKHISLEEAKKMATFAQKEMDSGFPLLHAHMLIGIWGALEAAVEDMLVGILVNEPELIQAEGFGKIRITLAEFEELEKEDRMRLLIQEIPRLQGNTRKQGVDKFEALLERFSLSKGIDGNLKKTLWEAHHLRNVIVHRASLADRRLVKSCPWLNLNIGDKVVITHNTLHQCYTTIAAYLTDIIYRLGDRYKVDIDSKIKAALPEHLQSTQGGEPVPS